MLSLPIPFRAVRTRFLCGVASPLPLDSPMHAVKALRGGELPAFDSLDDVSELLAALVMGSWNRLSRHQERSAPFRLTRQSFPESRESRAALAQLRREEIEGFVDGFFGDADQLDLPERAHKALGVLAELRALFEGAQAVAEDVNKPASQRDMATTLGHFREMTRVAFARGGALLRTGETAAIAATPGRPCVAALIPIARKDAKVDCGRAMVSRSPSKLSTAPTSPN